MGRNIEMTQEAEIIITNLEKYPSIKEFFGNIVKQRLQIDCYTHGVLTANLLVHEGLTICDLERLDYVLKLGNVHCRDFDRLFAGKQLPQQSEIADGQIVDILAEVKAFEFLHTHSFTHVNNVKRQASAKTVDFSAKRNNQNYAVEATRLGLAQSNNKQPVYTRKAGMIDYKTKCEDANGLEIRTMHQGLNKARIEREIGDAVTQEYPQIKEFCQAQTGSWKGILLISSGRDYFVMQRYENKSYEITPKKDFFDACEQVWQTLKAEGKDNYLHHLVITKGKDLGKAIIYPEL